MTILTNTPQDATLGFGLGGIIRGIGSIAGTLIPGVGGVVEGITTAIAGGPCPAGTACSGPVILGQCLGGCKPFGPQQFPGGKPALPGETMCPAGFKLAPGPGGVLQCVEEQAGMVTVPQANGKCPTTACALPDGSRGRLNKSSYHLKNGTFVPAGSRCVSSRRTDFGNIKAAARASRRIDGSLRHLEKLRGTVERALGSSKRPARRRSTARRTSASCKC